MKFLKILGIVVLIAIAALAVVIIVSPDETHMERKIVIAAPSKLIYQDLMIYRNFNTWNPWAAKDPNVKWEFSGPDIGVGASMKWVSESEDVGSGQMKMIDATYPTSVTYEMDFGYGKPLAYLYLEDVENGTQVTWTYDEKGLTGFSKLFGLMMDGFLGPDYESGLSNLKNRMESIPLIEYDMEVMEVSGYQYLSMSDTVFAPLDQVTAKLGQTYGQLMSYMGKNAIEQNGQPLAVYLQADESGFAFIPGIPVNATETMDEAYMIRQTAEGMVLRTAFLGPYDAMEPAYHQMESFIEFLNLESAGSPWEEYVTDPGMEPNPSNWLTHIYWPVQLKD
jgi:effector-binding domain-containing protein